MRPVPSVRRRLAFSLQLSAGGRKGNSQFGSAQRQSADFGRTFAHLLLGPAARSALMLLDMEGSAATAGVADHVRLRRALTERGRALRHAVAAGRTPTISHENPENRAGDDGVRSGPSAPR